MLLLIRPLVGLLSCQSLDEMNLLDANNCAPTRNVVVARVLDGDTFETTEGETIRLLGINAPEIEHPPDAEECWGSESATWLNEELYGQELRLGFDVTCEDAYERTLAYAWVEGPLEEDTDDVLINELSVREGQSRVYEDFDNVSLADVLYAAEALAQAESVGLWGVCES